MSIYGALITVGGAAAGGGLAALLFGPEYPGAGWLIGGLLLMAFTAVQIPPKKTADKPAGK
ncbi:hypothetical protein [Nocardiopsis synnemataformans]|uniref:hypothetical protein n=1 Tax=Nocardiopsis synnemataformans TaxID=61305 RepID=UPI003EBDE300